MNAAPTMTVATPKVGTSGRHLPTSDHDCSESQNGHVDGEHEPPAVDLSGWLVLRVLAEMFDDAEQFRIAQVNRTTSGKIDPGLFISVLDSIHRTEADAKRALRGCYRDVVPAPIRAWQKLAPGIGEHRLAMLLGRLGHPRIAIPHHWQNGPAPDGHACLAHTCSPNRHLIRDEPYFRTVAQLWQFCGHGDPDRSQARKGMTADQLAEIGSPKLKKAVYLIAKSTMIQKSAGGPYRLLYEDARERYQDRTHAAACPQCGPAGSPAHPGSPWHPAHQHAAALRLVGKEILRDLWIVSA